MGKGAYRGPWMFETTAREMAIDHAARSSGIDPIELRRRNLLRRPSCRSRRRAGRSSQEITPLETLEQALEMLDYDAFRAEQADGPRRGPLLGLGLCVYVEPTSMDGADLATEGATVRVEPSGKVVAFLGTTSHGQSVETTMAQIVADALGVDYDDVTIVQADTAVDAVRPRHRRQPHRGRSPAARHAAPPWRCATRSLAVAAHMLEADARRPRASIDGSVFVAGTPTRSVTLARGRHVPPTATPTCCPPSCPPGLEATVRFRPTHFPTWSNATHLCVVEIDPITCMPHDRCATSSPRTAGR